MSDIDTRLLAVAGARERVTCPLCGMAGERSRSNYHGTCGLSAYDCYYDEDGVWHSHHEEIRENLYSCTAGHWWHVDRVDERTCCAPVCEWRAELEAMLTAREWDQ